MNLHELNQNCPDCGEWFTRKNVFDRGCATLLESGKSILHCPECKETELHDADSYSIPTPYAQLKAKMVLNEIQRVESQLQDLQKLYKVLTYGEEP